MNWKSVAPLLQKIVAFGDNISSQIPKTGNLFKSGHIGMFLKTEKSEQGLDSPSTSRGEGQNPLVLLKPYKAPVIKTIQDEMRK